MSSAGVTCIFDGAVNYLEGVMPLGLYAVLGGLFWRTWQLFPRARTLSFDDDRR